MCATRAEGNIQHEGRKSLDECHNGRIVMELIERKAGQRELWQTSGLVNDTTEQK